MKSHSPMSHSWDFMLLLIVFLYSLLFDLLGHLHVLSSDSTEISLNFEVIFFSLIVFGNCLLPLLICILICLLTEWGSHVFFFKLQLDVELLAIKQNPFGYLSILTHIFTYILFCLCLKILFQYVEFWRSSTGLVWSLLKGENLYPLFSLLA